MLPAWCSPSWIQADQDNTQSPKPLNNTIGPIVVPRLQTCTGPLCSTESHISAQEWPIMRASRRMLLLAAAVAAVLAPHVCGAAPKKKKKGKVAGGPNEPVRPEDVPYIQCQVAIELPGRAPSTRTSSCVTPTTSHTGFTEFNLHCPFHRPLTGLPAASQERLASSEGDEEGCHRCPAGQSMLHAIAGC